MEVNGKFDLNVPLLEPQDSVTVNICPPSPCGDGKIKMVEYKIKGIECASCSTSVESMLGKLNGIKSLVVSPMDGQTVVKYVPEVVDVVKKNKRNCGKCLCITR